MASMFSRKPVVTICACLRRLIGVLSRPSRTSPFGVATATLTVDTGRVNESTPAIDTLSMDGPWRNTAGSLQRGATM
jgi:hypothetical protein